MSKLVFTFAAIACFMSTAVLSTEMLYPCKVKAVRKATGYSGNGWERQVYLSTKRITTVDFSGSGFNTILKIKVTDAGKLTGRVNGQYNFILRGTALEGSFESDSAKGTISCQQPEKLRVAYMFKPWNTLHRYDSGFDTIRNYPAYANTCYIGSSEQALKDYTDLYLKVVSPAKRVSAVQMDPKTKAINVYKYVRKCIEDNGGHPAEDYECLKYGKAKLIKFTVEDCDYEDPRYVYP